MQPTEILPGNANFKRSESCRFVMVTNGTHLDMTFLSRYEVRKLILLLQYNVTGKKLKFTLERAMKAQRRSRGVALFFLQPRR